MKITLILNVPKLKTTHDGQAFASSLAEHIVDTFNDDCSIESVKTSVPCTEKWTA
jgi:hypothetical protein